MQLPHTNDKQIDISSDIEIIANSPEEGKTVKS